MLSSFGCLCDLRWMRVARGGLSEEEVFFWNGGRRAGGTISRLGALACDIPYTTKKPQHHAPNEKVPSLVLHCPFISCIQRLRWSTRKQASMSGQRSSLKWQFSFTVMSANSLMLACQHKVRYLSFVFNKGSGAVTRDLNKCPFSVMKNSPVRS